MALSGGLKAHQHTSALDGGASISPGTLDIPAGTVVDADVNAAAAIDFSKIAGHEAPVFGRVVRSAGNLTTTSTSLVDVTGATVTFTTGAKPVAAGYAVTVTNNTGGNTVVLNIAVDGALELGTVGLYTAVPAASYEVPFSFTHQTAALAAASHTIKMQWAVNATTGTIFGSATTNFSFWAHEIT